MYCFPSSIRADFREVGLMLDKLCMSVAEDLSDCNLHLNIEEICNAYLGIDSPSPMMTFAKLSSACCIVLTNQAKSPSAPS